MKLIQPSVVSIKMNQVSITRVSGLEIDCLYHDQQVAHQLQPAVRLTGPNVSLPKLSGFISNKLQMYGGVGSRLERCVT